LFFYRVEFLFIRISLNNSLSLGERVGVRAKSREKIRIPYIFPLDKGGQNTRRKTKGDFIFKKITSRPASL